jgi:tRNA U34 5-methylaminomethyl-2-thiouridine-forming methyltransferase MnmC
MQNQTAQIEWRDGKIPVSTRFDDPYFSLENGLAETRHVFLDGNDLPERFCDGFRIGELGFGTGLNFLTAWHCWQQAQATGRLHFTSFEAYPMRAPDAALALAAFPELASLAAHLIDQWPDTGGTRQFPGGVTLTLIAGDARDTLPIWADKADAWFLDGFSPAKNPEMWEPTLLNAVACHTAPGGTSATYTAAGFVRRGLEDAGFNVTRAAGFGRKRHMTKAILA